MQKITLFTLYAVLISLLTVNFRFAVVKAASPSPKASPSLSPSPSPVDMNDVTENIKKKIQTTLDTEGSLPPSSAKAYLGVVKDVIKDTIVIQDKDGKKDIKLADNTTIVRSPGNAAIKAENIRIDDYIIAMGFLGSDGVMDGRRLIVSIDPIKPPAKTSGLGKITKIGKTSLTLSVNDNPQEVTLTTKTIYKSVSGTIDLTDLKVGDTLIYTAVQDDKDVLTATLIMRIQTAL